MRSWKYRNANLNRVIPRMSSPELKWHAWNKDRNYSNYSQPETVMFTLNGHCDRVIVHGIKFQNGKLPVIEMSNDHQIITTWWGYCQFNGQMINQTASTIKFKIKGS